MAHLFKMPGGVRISEQTIMLEADKAMEIGLWGFRESEGGPALELLHSPLVGLRRLREEGVSRIYSVYCSHTGTYKIEAITGEGSAYGAGNTWDWINLQIFQKTPTGGQWGGDSSLWPEDKKLRSMHPSLAAKIPDVLDGLRARGFQPKIFFAWRSVAVQQQLFARGVTKVKFSFHNAQKPDGTPNSYAADIVDKRYNWSATAAKSGFWTALGAEAKAQGLYWGGDWTGFRDWAHVQLTPNSELARVKRESGL